MKFKGCNITGYLRKFYSIIFPIYSIRNEFYQLFTKYANLSIVIATIFQVDAKKSAQRKNSVFHKRHSSCPRIPSLLTVLVSSRVKLDMSRIIEAKKSMIL